MDEATAIGRSRSTSPRPCSTCNSTNTAIRANASGSGTSRNGSSPPRTAMPQRCFRRRRSTHGPIRIDGAGEQSRSQAGDTEPGALLFREHHDRERSRPSASRERSTSNATSADATPSGPSKAPPPGTESRWRRSRPHRRGCRPVVPGPDRAVAIDLHLQTRFSACATNHSRSWVRLPNTPAASTRNAAGPARCPRSPPAARRQCRRVPCPLARSSHLPGPRTGEGWTAVAPRRTVREEVRRRDVRVPAVPVDDQIGHQIADGRLILNP